MTLLTIGAVISVLHFQAMVAGSGKNTVSANSHRFGEGRATEDDQADRQILDNAGLDNTTVDEDKFAPGRQGDGNEKWRLLEERRVALSYLHLQ